MKNIFEGRKKSKKSSRISSSQFSNRLNRNIFYKIKLIIFISFFSYFSIILMVSYFRRFLGIFRLFFFFSFIFIFGLSFNFLSLLIFPLRYFGPGISDYRAIQNRLQWIFNGFLVLLFEKFSGVRFHFSGEALNFWENLTNSIYICNSTGSADFLILLAIAIRRSWSPAGSMRFLFHNSSIANFVSSSPGLGWTRKFHEDFFAREISKPKLQQLREYFQEFRNSRSDISLAIFPEFGSIDQNICSTEFLRSPIHSGGFLTALDELTGIVREICDITIVQIGEDEDDDFNDVASDSWFSRSFASYLPLGDSERRSPSLSHFFAGSAPQQIYIHITNHPIESLPLTNPERRDWLIERFRAKNDLIRAFHDEGEFPDENYNYPLDAISLLRFFWFWIFVIWFEYIFLHWISDLFSFLLPGSLLTIILTLIAVASAVNLFVAYSRFQRNSSPSESRENQPANPVESGYQPVQQKLDRSD